MKELIIRTLTGIYLIILVAGAILLGPVTLTGILLMVALLGTRELFALYQLKMDLPRLWLAFTAILVIPISLMILQYQWSPWWLAGVAAGWITGLIWSGATVPGVLVLVWISYPLAAFLALGFAGHQGGYLPRLPLAVITLIWVNDTFAYLAGSKLGKHPLTPRLSPGKTWEGFIAGIMATLLAGWIISRISGAFTSGGWIAAALLVSFLALAGDLFESGLKRKKQVKNSGALLPGHGGILDRFDSLFFTAPGILILLYLFNHWI